MMLEHLNPFALMHLLGLISYNVQGLLLVRVVVEALRCVSMNVGVVKHDVWRQSILRKFIAIESWIWALPRLLEVWTRAQIWNVSVLPLVVSVVVRQTFIGE